MRPRRDPRPPRPPRVLTARLVVVSLVVGVVLAVGSVPAGVVVEKTSWISSRMRSSEVVYSFQRQFILVKSRQSFVGTMTHCDSSDMVLIEHAIGMREWREVQGVGHDPRPSFARSYLDGGAEWVVRWQVGWPLEAAYTFWWTSPLADDSFTGPLSTEQRGSVTLAALGQSTTIPYLPLWPGLLGNTLFYGLLVLTPLALLRRRKLRRRARRGLCVACGYELGAGVEACPECGLARRGS